MFSLRPLFLVASLLGSAVIADAQAPSHPVFSRYSKPLRSAHLDLSTGTVTVGPRPSARGAPTMTDFHNLDLGGFVGADTGGGFCEWFDAGVKGWTPGGGFPGTPSGNTSDLMSSITFAYCSSMKSGGSGGPGGSVRLGFYEGYTVFGGAPTTTAAAFTLRGLPANTASSCFFGGFSCYFIQVDFASLVCFADGPIGYSWRFIDVGTSVVNPLGAVIAGTWPFLACLASCSGTGGPLVPSGQGMVNVIDRYCPPGFLLASFTFGTSSGTFTSISMAIQEVVDATATVAGFNSSTFPNPDALAAGQAVVGSTWTATVNRGVASAPGAFSVLFAPNRLLPPTGVPLTPTSTWGPSKAGRMLLIALGSPLFVACSGTHNGIVGSCTAPIPKRLSLVGNAWNVQAVLTGTAQGPNRLSSGVGGVVGTHF